MSADSETAIRSEQQFPTPDSGAYGAEVQIIEPPRPGLDVNWAEIWRYRELLYFLTWRDVKIRYKQTALGAAWAIIQPVMAMIVFTVFFGRVAHLDQETGGIPYPIFVYAALLLWTFFANSVTNCANSVVGNANLITKIYFPRLIIPLASVGAALVDLAIASAVLVVLMFVYGTQPTWQILLTPIFVAGTVLTATGVGTLLAALTVAYRDFRYVVPFLVQTWMFVSGVFYPLAMVPERWRLALSLNPMAGLIEGFRAAFFGQPLDWIAIGTSVAVAAAAFLGGAIYFRRVERRFADII